MKVAIAIIVILLATLPTIAMAQPAPPTLQCQGDGDCKAIWDDRDKPSPPALGPPPS